MNANSASGARAYKTLPVIFFFLCSAFGQIPSRNLLNHLVGSWIMTGTVLKKPVQYRAEAAWVLQRQFLRLHMVDTSSPPTYEADLFIGLDTSKNQYVAHWLDKFGGAGARVFATGPLSSDKVEFTFPYEEGRFHDQFEYDSAKDEWSFVIESEGKGGQWTEFAHYAIKRR